MARSKNTKLLAHIDCPGGGQVWVDGKTLYIGHMREPTGTTIFTRCFTQRGQHLVGPHRLDDADGLVSVIEALPQKRQQDLVALVLPAIESTDMIADGQIDVRYANDVVGHHTMLAPAHGTAFSLCG